MEKCLIIINSAAGGSKKISFEKIERCLGERYVYTRFLLPDDGEWNADGFDAVAVAGGDGTLGSVLATVYLRPIDVFYFPAGTLNDRAKAERYNHTKTECPSCSDAPPRGKSVVVGAFESRTEEGTAQNGVFSYVLAAGSFTPIGYVADVKLKKRFGVLAYVGKILKEYRVHRIPATIRAGGKTYEGKFTLIMLVKSPRCFGFRFNRAFDAESMSGHLLAIRSPKHDGLLGKIELFFPFFRSFFMGLKKERDGNIIFKRVFSVDIEQDAPCDYCRDGEKYSQPAGKLKTSFKRSLCNFSVIDKY